MDGEKEALVELLNNHENLKNGITGVVCSVCNSLQCSFYEQEKIMFITQIVCFMYNALNFISNCYPKQLS